MGQRILLIVTSAILAACTATMAVYYFFFPPMVSTSEEIKGPEARIWVHEEQDLPERYSALYYIPITIFVLFFFALGAGIGTHFTVFIGDLPQQGLKFTLPAVMVITVQK